MTQHDSIQYIQCICYNKEQQRERENWRKTSFSIKNLINKILNIRYSATSQTIITQPITNDKTSHLICPSRWRAILLTLQCLSPSLSAIMSHGSKLRPVKSKTRVKDRDRQRIMNIPVPWELSTPMAEFVSYSTLKRLTFDGAKVELGKATGTIYPTGEWQRGQKLCCVTSCSKAQCLHTLHIQNWYSDIILPVTIQVGNLPSGLRKKQEVIE